jgi:hypothetical protein
MDATALLLSRLQFAFTISFHIIFPAFTIGLAAWLTVLEVLGRHRRLPAHADLRGHQLHGIPRQSQNSNRALLIAT